MPIREYDDFIVGKVAGPFPIVVDDQRVRDFVYATDDFSPWHISNSPFGAPIAPLSLLTLDDPDFALSQPPGPEDALAARYEASALEPIKIGQAVFLHARNADKYIRRGKAFISRDFYVTDGTDNRPLLHSQLTEMLGQVDAEDTESKSSGSFDRIVPRASKQETVPCSKNGLAVGSPLRELVKKPDRKRVFVFSGRPGWWSSIHTDQAMAQGFGFPDAIAQGLMSVGYIAQLCREFFQEELFVSGKVSATFLRPVCVDDVLTIGGCVTGYSTEGFRSRLHVDIWCQNQRLEVTTVARVSALIPVSASS